MSVKFVLNQDGLRELMGSAEMREALTEAGEAVARQGQALSGEPYKTRIVDAQWVPVCQVNPDSKEGYYDTIENNTALKALSAAGLPLKK